MIAERCRSLASPLFFDEAFIDFIPDEPGFIPAAGPQPARVGAAFRPFIRIPGLRLGYLVNGDARAVARMRERQMPWSINAFAALAGK
jgi:threonine-phosphate decarboxylase